LDSHEIFLIKNLTKENPLGQNFDKEKSKDLIAKGLSSFL